MNNKDYFNAADSVEAALTDVKESLIHLLDAWSYNSENVDLNELDSISQYPFDKSLDELVNDYINWSDCTIDEIKSKCKKRNAAK